MFSRFSKCSKVAVSFFILVICSLIKTYSVTTEVYFTNVLDIDGSGDFTDTSKFVAFPKSNSGNLPDPDIDVFLNDPSVGNIYIVALTDDGTSSDFTILNEGTARTTSDKLSDKTIRSYGSRTACTWKMNNISSWSQSIDGYYRFYVRAQPSGTDSRQVAYWVNNTQGSQLEFWHSNVTSSVSSTSHLTVYVTQDVEYRAATFNQGVAGYKTFIYLKDNAQLTFTDISTPVSFSFNNLVCTNITKGHL